MKNLFRNDIYGSYLVDIVLNDEDQKKSNLNQIFISIIHPAKPKDIEKYLDHPMHLILETAELYNTVTKPYIDALVNTAGHLQWLYNVLEHKAEVIFNNFMIFILYNKLYYYFCRRIELFMKKIWTTISVLFWPRT